MLELCCTLLLDIFTGKEEKKYCGKTKGKLEAALSNQRRFGYIMSLQYFLVVILGARIDIIQPQIRNFMAYLLPDTIYGCDD